MFLDLVGKSHSKHYSLSQTSNHKSTVSSASRTALHNKCRNSCRDFINTRVAARTITLQNRAFFKKKQCLFNFCTVKTLIFPRKACKQFAPTRKLFSAQTAKIHHIHHEAPAIIILLSNSSNPLVTLGRAREQRPKTNVDQTYYARPLIISENIISSRLQRRVFCTRSPSHLV